jgi:hypothetical protein
MLVVSGLPNLTGSVIYVRKRMTTIVSLSKVPDLDILMDGAGCGN